MGFWFRYQKDAFEMQRSKCLSLASILLPTLFCFSMQAHPKQMTSISKSAVRAKELASLIDTLQISISIQTAKGKRISGISNLLLYVTSPACIEPASIGPDGKPVSAAAKVSAQEAKAVIDVLTAQGFLEKASKFYSNRIALDKKFPPLADSTEYNSPPYPNGEIKLTVYDEHWYTYYEGGLPAGGNAALILNALKRTLSGKAAAYMQELSLNQIKLSGESSLLQH